MTSIIRFTKTKVFKSEEKAHLLFFIQNPLKKKKPNKVSMFKSCYLNVTFENQSPKNVRVNYDQNHWQRALKTVTYKQMLKMPNCDHKCCSDCATNFFTIVVTDQNISQAVCPFCREPSNLADDDEVGMRKKGFPYFVIFTSLMFRLLWTIMQSWIRFWKIFWIRTLMIFSREN